MAGTRLAAHSFFLAFALIVVLVAWRLGVVKRAPLPLREMANPSIGSRSFLDHGGQPQPLPVDIDVVLLRNPSDDGCPSCIAVMNSIQANPSLVRIAFLDVAASVERATDKDVVHQTTTVGSQNGTTDEPASVPEDELFSIRTVNLRVVHTNRGPPSVIDVPLASRDPVVLDEWLHESFIAPSSPARGAVPTYTFFLGCNGGGVDGRDGDIPTFVMGKRRHGYLALGCERNRDCYCEDGGGGGSDASSGKEDWIAGKEGGGAAPGARPEVVARGLVAAEVLGALARVVVAHVLRTPVPAGDVHVRLGQAYRLSFSLLSEDPTQRRCTWDFAAASRRYLRPVLRKLDPVASFAVQSQEVLYGRLVPAPPRRYSAMNRWYYSPFDLQSFLGANDFSILDLAAGWGAEETADGMDSFSGNPNSAVPTPHSQVPVNFMVFCPSPEYTPLVFMEDWAGAGGRNRPAAEAFEVPGFGGVSVVNVDDTATGQGGDIDALEPNRLRRALGAHASQLRRIIGLPRSSDMPSEMPWPRLPQEEPEEGVLDRKIGGGSGGGGGGSGQCDSCAASPSGPRDHPLPLTFLPSPTDGFTDWEVDALLRAGLARNRAAAAETLRSLAALVKSQPEMEVSSKVAEDVVSALKALAEVDAAVSKTWLGILPEEIRPAVGVAAPCRERGNRTRGESALAANRKKQVDFSTGIAGKRGIDWPGVGAMRWAREALRRSEAAYFDPTMVPQLYFPEDYLLAVYLPFLGPLAFPLLGGFVQEIVRYYRKKRRKANSQGTKEEGGGTGSESESGTSSETDGAAR